MMIRGIFDEVHSRLKERARRNRWGLNQEVMAELSEATMGLYFHDERFIKKSPALVNPRPLA